MGKPENVIDEQEHVLALHITEVFRNRQTSQGNPHPGTRWFVHLTINHGRLFQNPGGLHFVVHIVTFTGPFTNTREDRNTIVALGNIVNQFLNQNGLTNTGTTEQTNLTTTNIWSQQVNNLDPGFQDFRVVV